MWSTHLPAPPMVGDPYHAIIRPWKSGGFGREAGLRGDGERAPHSGGPNLLSPAKDAVVGGDVRCMADCLSPHAFEATCSLVADSDRLATIARTKEGQGGARLGVAELTANANPNPRKPQALQSEVDHEHSCSPIYVLLAAE